MRSYSISLDSLPLEIFRQILIEAVRGRNLERALRLRLVSKRFSDELIDAIRASNSLVVLFWDVQLEHCAWIIPYLERKLCERCMADMPYLRAIGDIAEALDIEVRTEQPRSESRYEEYASLLLRRALYFPFYAAPFLCSLARPDAPIMDHSLKFSPTVKDQDIATAAVHINHLSVATRLASRIPSTLHRPPPPFYVWRSPFLAAIQTSNTAALRMLLDVDERTENAVLDDDKRTYLMEVAFSSGSLPIAEFMLHYQHPSGCYPFKPSTLPYPRITDYHVHSWSPNVGVLKLLVADLETRFPNFLRELGIQHVLRIAVTNNATSVVKWLLELGAIIPDPADTKVSLPDQLVAVACREQHGEVLELLLENGGRVYGKEFGIAVRSGNASILKMCLDHGGNVRSRHVRDGLYSVARTGVMDAMKLLLEAGVDPNTGTISPLVGAVEAEHEGMFRLLLEHGADVNCAMVEAKERARSLGLESMLALLGKYEHYDV
ncbi:ankyrin [Westerdykella ornata]|uniref:Ankyrin n=1 Tax=Westerdykella ornata TaxID=318751 RepID=A0A6A6JDA1_WESOR|nr:ankyrin [Westerdykella ornata]KAF2274412.1 ankyrin [Westerdykella ornata]